MLENLDQFKDIKLDKQPSIGTNYEGSQANTSSFQEVPDLDKVVLGEGQHVSKKMKNDDMRMIHAPSFYNAQALDESPAVNLEANKKFSKKVDNEPLTSKKVESSDTLELKNSAHPYVCMVTIFFKAAAVAMYVLFAWIFTNTMAAFISVSVLLSMDFWVVKNISGRMLVGLRWWVRINDDGSEQWIYETKNTEGKTSRVDYAVFWYLQVLTFLFFILTLIICLLTWSLTWACLNVLAISLLGCNIVSFLRCSRVQQKKLKGAVNSVAQKAAKKVIEKKVDDTIKQATQA